MMTEPELLKKLEGIPHLLCRSQAYWLYRQCLRLPESPFVLEIGIYHGCSSAAMGLGLAEACSNPIMLSIDRDPAATARGQANWKALGLHLICFAEIGDSATDLPRLLEKWGHPKIAFAFIDGDHVGEAPARDLRNIIPVMKPGGRIAMHDYTEQWPDVIRAWDTVAVPILKNFESCESIASGEAP